jgi:hypothetical protein
VVPDAEAIGGALGRKRGAGVGRGLPVGVAVAGGVRGTRGPATVTEPDIPGWIRHRNRIVVPGAAPSLTRKWAWPPVGKAPELSVVVPSSAHGAAALPHAGSDGASTAGLTCACAGPSSPSPTTSRNCRRACPGEVPAASTVAVCRPSGEDAQAKSSTSPWCTTVPPRGKKSVYSKSCPPGGAWSTPIGTVTAAVACATTGGRLAAARASSAATIASRCGMTWVSGATL